MAKKAKSKTTGNKKPLSEQAYIKKFGRTLPVEKCEMTYVPSNPHTVRVLVVRKEPTGLYTIGFYLIDSWCRGLYDTYCRAHVSQEKLDEILSMDSDIRKIVPMTYEEAHNYIFGAIEYGEEAGFHEPKEFEQSKYVLAEDTDDMPLISYEWGLDGKRVLECSTQEQFDRAKKILERNLTPDEYVLIGNTGPDFGVDEDDDYYYNDEDIVDELIKNNNLSDRERDILQMMRLNSEDLENLSSDRLYLIICTIAMVYPIVAKEEGLAVNSQIKEFLDKYEELLKNAEDEAFDESYDEVVDIFLDLVDYTKYVFLDISNDDYDMKHVAFIFHMLLYAIYSQSNSMSDREIKECLVGEKEMSEVVKECIDEFVSIAYDKDASEGE